MSDLRATDYIRCTIAQKMENVGLLMTFIVSAVLQLEGLVIMWETRNENHFCEFKTGLNDFVLKGHHSAL